LHAKIKLKFKKAKTREIQKEREIKEKEVTKYEN